MDQHRLPVTRGIELTPDDLVRRTVIMGLMCQGEVSMESVEIAHLIHFESYFESELRELASFAAAGLIEIEGGYLTVSPKGRFFLRGICMVFDRYLAAERARTRYSKII